MRPRLHKDEGYKEFGRPLSLWGIHDRVGVSLVGEHPWNFYKPNSPRILLVGFPQQAPQTPGSTDLLKHQKPSTHCSLSMAQLRRVLLHHMQDPRSGCIGEAQWSLHIRDGTVIMTHRLGRVGILKWISAPWRRWNRGVGSWRKRGLVRSRRDSSFEHSKGPYRDVGSNSAAERFHPSILQSSWQKVWDHILQTTWGGRGAIWCRLL